MTRSRRHFSVELQKFYNILHKTILQYQDPITGLLPGSPDTDHAWIRDNVYSITSAWCLSMAYAKSADYDEDRAKAFQLRQSTIRCMRGLLRCFVRERHKIEKFKETNSPEHSIHAKFSSKTGLPVVGDREWGHLQIDAISLYLLTLAQMTAAGIYVVYNYAEVAIIQNLVHFIESAYCIPDFGIWERGDKSNTGIVELNSSSIGMALSAMQAMDGLNLFGPQADSTSCIHVMLDEVYKCKAILHSMLPRESLSKETDSSLLTVVGYPAFAVENQGLVDKTTDEIMGKLLGKYGCIRFLRDGYKTPIEDSSRLHYEPWELHLFQNIECQWPLFLCFLVINNIFDRNTENVRRFSKALDSCIVWKDNTPLVPELYAFPKVEESNKDDEKNGNGEPEMCPSGRTPLMWAQSMYLIGCMIIEGHVAMGELDPINRRLSSIQRPETIVQVVLLAENKNVQDMLAQVQLNVKTVAEAAPVEVHSSSVLSRLYSYLGKNVKLGLTGRRNRDTGVLMTSKLYKINKKLFAFVPQRFNYSRSYMDCDSLLMVSTLEYGLNSLASCWSALGRPTLTLVLEERMLDDGKISTPMAGALKKVRNGLIAGVRVILGDYERFFPTSCIVDLSFLNCIHDGNQNALLPEVSKYISEQACSSTVVPIKLLGRKACDYQDQHRRGVVMRKNSARGTIRRTRSTQKGKGAKGLSILERKNSPMDFTASTTSGASDAATTELETDDDFCSEQERHQALQEFSQFQGLGLDQLVERLADAGDLEEQADILHYIVLAFGFRRKIDIPDEKPIEVRDLLKTLYDTAVVRKQWAIVRHFAGYLGRRFDDLSKAVTDMIVRQKQVTVGMPPHHEVILSGGSFKLAGLCRIIHQAYCGDQSLAMLSQELLVYLSMFIQTEPELFHGMLRIRVGLIIQVLAAEMQRSLKLDEHADIMEELMSLSPFQMRNLLHHLMAGKEFEIVVEKSTYSVKSEAKCVLTSLPTSNDCVKEERSDDSDDSDDSAENAGSWLRRRRLDGALNRVPRGFYTRVWDILQKCNTILIHEEKRLDTSLTQAMTRDELKFALVVENVLNTVPEPEYRQSLVEVLVVLSEFITEQAINSLDDVIDVGAILRRANQIFLEDQAKFHGDTSSCCSSSNSSARCNGARGICKHFYDSAPIGQYGTVPYVTRAMCNVLTCVPKEGYLECRQM